MNSNTIGAGLMLMVLLGMFIFSGCEKGDTSKKDSTSMSTSFTAHGDCCYTKVIEIEGHKYVLFSGYKCGGIIHAESCNCKKGF